MAEHNSNASFGVAAVAAQSEVEQLQSLRQLFTKSEQVLIEALGDKTLVDKALLAARNSVGTTIPDAFKSAFTQHYTQLKTAAQSTELREHLAR